MDKQKRNIRRKRMITGFSIACAAALMLYEAGAEFVPVQGIGNARILQVASSPSHPSFLAVAAENALYVSDDGAGTFQRKLVLKDEQINRISMDPQEHQTIYLAASRNGYRIGESSERIFTTTDGKAIYHIIRNGDWLYAGTSDGLYRSEAALIKWRPISGLMNHAVLYLEPSGQDLYLACDDGVYRYRPGDPPERLFLSGRSDDGSGMILYQVKVDTEIPSRLWLCTSRGLYYSNDRGVAWQKLYVAGTGGAAVRCMAQQPQDENNFYLCTDAGCFSINIRSGESRSLFEGLSTTNVHWVELTASGEVYLATDQGLFREDSAIAEPRREVIDLAGLLEGEPSIQEVQEAAMRYNAVHPDKTESWRKRIKYRALMPRISLDYDKTIGSSFTSSGHYYAQGPYDWGVSLTWDMGDLLWNSYEDDIDNRTKLTTQLRMDILDEVNRLYFERLRLKLEIAQVQSRQEDATTSQLRLYEITATLDGYTGGLYSAMQPAGGP